MCIRDRMGNKIMHIFADKKIEKSNGLSRAFEQIILRILKPSCQAFFSFFSFFLWYSNISICSTDVEVKMRMCLPVKNSLHEASLQHFRS